MAKTRYFKLGLNASVFYDPSTGLKVVQGKTSEYTRGQVSKRMDIAIKNGHIVEVKEGDQVDNTSTGGPDSGPDFSRMRKDDLVAYYESNFEVEEADVEAFKAKTKDDMVEELNDLMKDDE